MSFFSRLFRKAPPVVPVAAPVVPKQSAAERAQAAAARAQLAAAEESALQAAIDARDSQAVARLVVAGTSTKVRQAAAHAIEDLEVLRQLIRDVRGGNDNSVYKVLTARRDALLEQARKLEELRVEIDAASAALERHSQRPYDVLFSQRLEQFEQRWLAVAGQADPELCGKVQQWTGLARATEAEHLREVAERAARELAAANAAAESQRLRREQKQAQELEQEQAAAAVAAEPEPVVEEPGPAPTEQQQAEQQAVRELGEMIRKARAALSAGSSSRAAGLRQAVEARLAGAPPLPAKLLSQLQQLDQQLDELKDWKSFSVTPKRAELIEEMEALIGAPFEPLDLADRIKGLKDEWRTLGKGVGENLEADMQRFQAAAQQAYLPCAEYLAAQALILAENLRRRDAVLANLVAFEAGSNWEQADWRLVITTLREAKEAWRACGPVDRRAARQQQDRFTALAASLQARVDAEHARNLQQKTSLIERAQAALAGDDVRRAIDTIKKLQQEWQSVGPVPREADQRLWGEFRRHCDAVFQKRERESASHSAGLENNKAQALALCDQLDQIAALDGAELLQRTAELAELRSAFAALGEFPRADARELRNRFEQGQDRCKASIARHHARAAEQGWNDLFEAANHVRAYRFAAARQADPQQVEALKETAETYIAAVPRWPRSGLDTLKQGLAAAGPADFAANEKALRMLCIRAEILTDTPTPAEDQALRREYQLQRLVQSLGQGIKADDAQLDAMALEWVAAGAVDEAAYQPLLQRFRRCRGR